MLQCCFISRLPPLPRGRWPAAPPAAPAGWTPCRSAGRSSAWRPAPPEPTAAVSCVCWARARSLRRPAVTASSEHNFLKTEQKEEDADHFKRSRAETTLPQPRWRHLGRLGGSTGAGRCCRSCSGCPETLGAAAASCWEVYT